MPECKKCGGRTRHSTICCYCSRHSYYEHFPPKKRRSRQEVWSEKRRKEREKCQQEGHDYEQREGYKCCRVCDNKIDTEEEVIA